MQVTLNGEEQTLADGLTLEDLLCQNNVGSSQKRWPSTRKWSRRAAGPMSGSSPETGST